MFQAILRPFLTAARRGAKDRRANAPGVVAYIRMRDYSDGGGSVERDVAPFVATVISSSEEQIDKLEERYSKHCSKLNAEASHIADHARKAAKELGDDAQRYESLHGSRTFPERPISPRAKVAILISLAVGEVGFNLQSFNRFGFSMPDSLTAFASGGWQVYAVAGIASALLPFIGHRVGYHLKFFNRQSMTRNERITLAVSVIGAAWLIGFLTILRAEGHEIAGGGLASFLMHAAFNVAMTVAGYLVAFWYHFDDAEIEDLAARQDRNIKRLSKLQKAFSKKARKHDPLLKRIKANADKIRDNAATRAAEYIDFNLRGDVGDNPHLNRITVRDLFRPREFDHARPLADTPPTMTQILVSAGILTAEQASDGTHNVNDPDNSHEEI